MHYTRYVDKKQTQNEKLDDFSEVEDFSLVIHKIQTSC